VSIPAISVPTVVTLRAIHLYCIKVLSDGERHY
jgi:hypothetical protein